MIVKLYISLFFVAIALYSNGCYSMAPNIILMEARTNKDESVSYQLTYLDRRGNSLTLAEAPYPMDIVQCHQNAFVYLAGDGHLWQLTPPNKTPKLIGKTAIDTASAAYHRSILEQDKHHFFLLGRNKDKNNTLYGYTLTRYGFDGTADLLASGAENVYQLWKIQPDVIELITSNGLIDISISTKEKTIITPFNQNELSHIGLIKDGYSFIGKDHHLEVRAGLVGDSVMQFDLEHANPFIVDFAIKDKSLLTVVLHLKSGTDDLMEVGLNNKTGRVVYRAESIGGACYLMD